GELFIDRRPFFLPHLPGAAGPHSPAHPPQNPSPKPPLTPQPPQVEGVSVRGPTPPPDEELDYLVGFPFPLSSIASFFRNADDSRHGPYEHGWLLPQVLL